MITETKEISSYSPSKKTRIETYDPATRIAEVCKASYSPSKKTRIETQLKLL